MITVAPRKRICLPDRRYLIKAVIIVRIKTVTPMFMLAYCIQCKLHVRSFSTFSYLAYCRTQDDGVVLPVECRTSDREVAGSTVDSRSGAATQQPWASCSHHPASVTKQYKVQTPGSNGRLWKLYGLPDSRYRDKVSIARSVSSLPTQDHGNEDERRTRISCDRALSDNYMIEWRTANVAGKRLILHLFTLPFYWRSEYLETVAQFIGL